jgi:P-type Cu+ transporter
MPNQTILLSLDGMSCQGCVARVEKILVRAGLPQGSTVDIGSVRLTGDAVSEVDTAVAALEKAGYQVNVQVQE